MNSASIKVEVVDGDKWTTIKRPTVVFDMDIE
jgi:hypothetical protein